MKRQKILPFLMFVFVVILFVVESNPAFAQTIRDRKYVTHYQDGVSVHTNQCGPMGPTYGYRMINQWETNYPQSYNYNDGRYSGTIPRVNTVFLGTDTRPAPPCSSKDDVGNTFDRTYNYRAIYEGWVDAPVSDPSNNQPSPGTTNGGANGRAFWELRRTDSDKPSKVFAENAFTITGSHYAIRNQQHWMNIGNLSLQQAGPISRIMDQNVKGTQFNYSFQYEYTNYYRDVYTSVDARGGGCYAWTYSGRVPAWNLGSTFSLAGSIPIDHSQGETIRKSTMDQVLAQRWIVGREDVWNPNLKQKPYYEQLRRASDNDRKTEYDLKTQSSLPITPGKWIYEIELPSGSHKAAGFTPLKKGGSNGYYYPIDLDESLKNQYKK